MNYWQFKFNSKIWKDWETVKFDEIIEWQPWQTIVNEISINDIVFIYRGSIKINRGIYFVTKVVDIDYDDDYPVKLKIIKNLRKNVFAPENFGFEEVVQKINALTQGGEFYKFLKNENPKKIYDLIMDDSYITFLPEEINKNESKKLTEGAKTKITVNKYERNLEARIKCIEKYGYSCCICGFNFEKTYGNIGKEFIHVHHLKELSTIKEKYEVNPIEDLRPVCPNCHAMLHKKNPAYSIEEIQNFINKKDL